VHNPLESEEAAFRFVIGAIAYFAPIVVAAWIATWLGVIVFVVMSALAFVVVRRGTASAPPVVSTERAAVDDTHQILVVTDAMTIGPRLREAILALAEGVTEDVLLICAVGPPAAAEHGGEVAGNPRAEELEATLGELRSAGINARGSVAVADPVRALEAALQTSDADELVISVTTASTEDLVEAARSLFAGHVTAIVEVARKVRQADA
jgi:hypothetical protein